MIFALATDEMNLLVFPASQEATACCEGIDVEAGVWLFWNEDGLPLQPDFLTPNRDGRLSVVSGIYRLIPAPSGRTLAEILGDIRAMDPNPFFPTIAALQARIHSRNGHASGKSLRDQVFEPVSDVRQEGRIQAPREG